MMPRPHRTPAARPAKGFTLVELILVIVIGGIIAATLTVFMRPALDSFLSTRGLADLSDQADTSLRRMLRDVRHAVPNSLRVPNDKCFELVPAVSGGRYRMGPDVSNDSAVGCTPTNPANACAAYINTEQPSTMFDSLSELSTPPSAGDWVVINNQNGNDVYAGTNRSAITLVGTPAATQGYHRLSMSSMQVSPGYTGGRFLIVKSAEPSVFYICTGADGSLDANGNGKGTLFRLVRSFNATYPATCPATSGAVPMATNVKSCSFVYDPNQGATQQSGFLWMDLEIARNHATAHLAVGAHVMNVP